MNETLQEYVDSRGMSVRVDRQAGVLRGVKILGLASRNNRRYLPEALAQAAPLYEGAKVNVNHPKGNPSGPRDYQDRIGVIRNVAAQGDAGLFGDFHFNPRHALAEQLLWDAEHAPENVGFSHNVEARTTRQGDQLIVEAITKVQSVDLVADPATTRGLFESVPDPVAGLTLDDLRQHRPDLVEAIAQSQQAELQRLREDRDRLQAQEAAQRKSLAAQRLLREFRLPDPDAADPRARAIVGPRFLQTLLAAPDESAMRELVEERARLVESLAGAAHAGRPVSRDPSTLFGPDPLDVKSFVESIT